MVKRCSVCEEDISQCDECSEKFKKGDGVKCGSMGEHFCDNCEVFDEGEVI